MKTNRSTIRSLIRLLCVTTASFLFVAPPAQAGYIVTLEQVGPNVVATGRGAIDLTGLGFSMTTSEGISTMDPTIGVISTGPAAFTNADVYSGTISGPTNFGSGGITPANSGSGDLVAIFAVFGFLEVPHGYVSGTALSDSSTYNGATFSSLGVIPGTYVWTWGTGVKQNFTLTIPPGVPDTGSTFGLFFLSLLILLAVTRFRLA